MSISRDMREQLTSSAAGRSSLMTTIVIGVAAFAIGAVAIGGWKMIAPSSKPAGTALTELAAPRLAGNRLGRAEHAPLLRTCVKAEFANGLSPEAFYTFLTAAGTMGRIAPLLGSKEFDNRGLITEYWKMIAECVYQQNGWHLCDPDNRALAVTSASAFVRESAHVTAQPADKSRVDQMILSDNARASQRVLDAVRTRVRNGQLIAADFGMMPPPEIKTLLAETRAIANACDKR